MKNDRNFLPLNWIVWSFYSVSVVLPYSENESRLRQNVSKIVNSLIIVLLIYSMCNDLYFAFHENNDEPFGFLISVLGADLCSISIRLVLTAKRQFIANMLRNIFILNRKLETKGNVKWYGASLMSAFAVSWIIPLIVYTKLAIFAMTDKGSRAIQINMLLGYHSQDVWGITCALLITLFLNQQFFALTGYAAGLCYYTYKILTAAIQNVEKNLRRKSNLDSLYVSYMNLTSQVVDSIKEVEQALSLLLFFLYTYIISFIFLTVTLIVRIGPLDKRSEYELIHFIIVFIAFIAFFGLSFQSVNVHKASVRIKRTIHRMCSKIYWPTNENEDAIRVLLLTASDTFPAKVLVTGWQLFDLNYDFILQTTGAIVSYGLVVSQLGSDKD